MLDSYILIDGKPVLCTDPLHWSDWMHGLTNRIVVQTIEPELSLKVSTVFIGIDHNFSGVGPPHLFETMVFQKGVAFDEIERYATREDALAGHERFVKKYL